MKQKLRLHLHFVAFAEVLSMFLGGFLIFLGVSTSVPCLNKMVHGEFSWKLFAPRNLMWTTNPRKDCSWTVCIWSRSPLAEDCCLLELSLERFCVKQSSKPRGQTTSLTLEAYTVQKHFRSGLHPERHLEATGFLVLSCSFQKRKQFCCCERQLWAALRFQESWICIAMAFHWAANGCNRYAGLLGFLRSAMKAAGLAMSYLRPQVATKVG